MDPSHSLAEPTNELMKLTKMSCDRVLLRLNCSSKGNTMTGSGYLIGANFWKRLSTSLRVAHWALLVLIPQLVNAEDVLTGATAREYALMLCQGYEANRKSLSQFVCRFTIACGPVELGEQGWEQGINSPKQRGVAFLWQDGETVCYKLESDGPNQPIPVGDGAIAVDALFLERAFCIS
jgi:hypothetical protein